jgi:hypothetical protein
MGLKESLRQEIDKERFDRIFDVLFIRPETVIEPEFYTQEIERATANYPLLRRLIEKGDELALQWRDEGQDETPIDNLLQGLGIACLSIEAYLSATPESDIPEN